MENMDKGLTVPKMGADKSAENTPNAPKFICPNCLLKPKSLGFRCFLQFISFIYDVTLLLTYLPTKYLRKEESQVCTKMATF